MKEYILLYGTTKTKKENENRLKIPNTKQSKENKNKQSLFKNHNILKLQKNTN